MKEEMVRPGVAETPRSGRPQEAPSEGMLSPQHQDTFRLVHRFSEALADKLARAELKYGYTNGWHTEDWEDECRRQLRVHMEKGDPLDVAAYAAFCWGNGWSTAQSTHAGVSEEALDLLGEAWGALNFILAFYDPNQRHLDTNAWKQAENGGRHARAKLREYLDRTAAPIKGGKQ